MKQQHQLTAEDLVTFPIWRFVDPSKRDVEPFPKKGGAPLLSLVATECASPDGSTHRGFAILTKLNLVAPILFGDGGQIPLYHGDAEPSPEFLARAYDSLGRRPGDLFPLRIRMTVTSQHRPLGTVYDGFVYRRDDGTFAAVR